MHNFRHGLFDDNMHTGPPVEVAELIFEKIVNLVIKHNKYLQKEQFKSSLNNNSRIWKRSFTPICLDSN